MRKLKLFLSLLMVMALSLGNVWADEETYSMTPNAKTTGNSATSYQSSLEFTYNGIGWTMAQINPSTLQTKTNQSSASAEFNFHNTSAFPGRISKVVVTYKALTISTGKESEFKFVGGTSEVTNLSGGDAATWNSTAKTMTWTPASTTNYTYFAYYMNGKTATGSNYLAEADAIVVTYEVSGGSCTNEITITKADNPEEGLFTIDKSGKVCIDEGNATVNVTATPNTGYHLATVSSTAGVVGSIDGNTCAITGINANTTISVTFAENPKYTVSFNTGEGNPGVDPITETTAGTGITLPAGPTPACSAAGWSFAGWAAAAVASETTTAPTFLSGNYKPTENVTLYAVYKRTEGGGDGAAVGTTLFSENFGTFSADSVPNGETSATTGRVIYGGGSVTYTSADNGSNLTKIYNDALAGGTAPELLVGKSGGIFTIAGIPSGKADKIGVSFKQNAQKLTVSLTGEGYSTTYASPKPSAAGEVSFDINVADGADETFAMVLTAGSSNVRVDDISITVASSSTAGTNYYLSAPSCCTKHNVNIALGIENGKVEADLAEACVGTVVTLTATPNAHCQFGKWSVNGGEVEVIGNQFTMPDEDVTVSATFAEIRNTVNIVNPDHGDITVTGADGLDAVLEGTELSVEVSGAGYEFTLEAYKVGDESTKVPITDGKLTMPAYGIVITAEEQKLVSPTILVSKDAIDFGKAVKGGAAPAFETFTISGANLTGDLSLAWEESDGYFTWTVTEGSLTANAGIVEATISVTATEKAMNTAGTLMDNLIVSGGGATQKEVMVGVEVQQTYTAKWFVNGEELTESTQTAVAGTDLIVPTNPTKLADDCADLKFRGWAAAPIDGKLDEAPEFVTTEGLKMGDADANYYAVFATENKEEIDGDIEWVATAFADLATNDSIVVTYAKSSVVYALPNNEGTSSSPDATVVTVANGKLSAEPAATLRWKAVKDGDNIQFATGTSFLYCTNSNDGVRVGSGTANVFSIKDNYIYTSLTTDARYVGVNGTQDWRCYKSINSNIQDATLAFYKKTVSKQEVTSYIDFRTTCPSCKTVTLLKADAEHGSFILKQNGVEVTAPVKTCDAAEITIEATPNPGCQFKFANISTLSGASISGTTITLEAGTEGELTVSASFAQNDYKVVLLQTGDAEAELTGATEAAHYGDKIDVSAPAMGGFHFIGWEASGVTLTDATALSQSFSMPANDVTLTAKYAKILTVAEAIAKINADGTSNDQVVEGYISQIDSYNSKYSSITYWIKDIDANGFLTGTAFEVYGGLGLNGAGFTSEDNIVVGAKVRVFGQIKYYETQSIYEFNSNNYQLAYDAGTYTGVVIYGEASKTAYEAGEAFEFDGLNAKDTWSNGYASLLTVKDDGLTWTATPDNITESGDVTVKASYEYDEKTYEGTTKVAVTVLTHAVTFEAPANGSLVVKNGETPITSGDKFVKGTVLTVEATPAIGYKLATLTVNGNDVKAEKQFEIGTESQYEVVATFSEKAEAGIAWSAAEATAVDYEGAVNALPTLTNAASLEVAYESTNTDVAEIAANGDVTIKAAGTATIKAIFAGNETYKAATVTYELTVNHVPVVKLAGTFNSWTGALLTPNEDYTKASVKVNLTADSWPLFKMIVDEAWLGLPKDGDNYYLFHRDWYTAAIEDAGENIQLKADFEGEYTFTWTYATNTLTITFPDMPEPEYYIAGDFTSWETNMAKMTEDAGMYIATVTINATEKQLFKVVRVQGPYKTWYGLAGESTMTSENCTNWSIGGDANIGLQPSYAGKYTFYFNEGEMQLTIDMPTEPGTALDTTEAGEKAAKVMKNGQFFIIKNGKTFNAQGAVVK